MATEVSLGNVYELNKSLIKQLKPMTPMEIAAMQEKITEHIKEQNFTYYTLMCREKYDFTIFNLNTCNYEDVYSKTSKELFELAFERGQIIEVNKDEHDYGYEIWLLIEDEVYLYLFYPFDLGVIEIK